MSPSSENPNAELLAIAVGKLAPLLDRIVFVGGCATGALITDPAATPVRVTFDVDAIVEIGSYAEFTVLGNRLRECLLPDAASQQRISLVLERMKELILEA